MVPFFFLAAGEKVFPGGIPFIHNDEWALAALPKGPHWFWWEKTPKDNFAFPRRG